MARGVAALIVVAGFVLFVAKYGPDWADLILGFCGLLAYLSSERFQKLISNSSRWIRSRSSWLAVAIRQLAPAFTYVDFSLVLASLIVFCAGLSSLFRDAVQDLSNKGFLSFNLELGGFVHLQLYILGFTFMPPLLLAAAGYGYYRGVRDGRASFGKLMLAVLWGFLAAIFLLSLRDGFVGFENYDKISHVTPDSLPIGAEPTSPAIIGSFAVASWLAFTACVWIFSLLGRVIRRPSPAQYVPPTS
jgi:hypothetical protein